MPRVTINYYGLGLPVKTIHNTAWNSFYDLFPYPPHNAVGRGAELAKISVIW